MEIVRKDLALNHLTSSFMGKSTIEMISPYWRSIPKCLKILVFEQTEICLLDEAILRIIKILTGKS